MVPGEEIYEYDKRGNLTHVYKDGQLVNATTVFRWDSNVLDAFDGEETYHFGFTGYQFDSIANTYFAQAREYQSGTGRFIAEDLVKGNGTYPFTLNDYGYC